MKPSKSRIRSLTRNSKLKLRDGVHRHLKDREWFFHKLDHDVVHLLNKSGLFAIGVKIEDIDWSTVTL